MSTENHQNKVRMQRLAPDRSEDMDSLIEETERQISNTRRFLESLHQS